MAETDVGTLGRGWIEWREKECRFHGDDFKILGLNNV